MAGQKLPRRVTIATNNGDIGGGEVMLLNIARACAELGVDVTIVGPSQPSELVDSARAAGFETVVLEASGRREWMRSLRRWDARERRGLLWCNGLVPALATVGHADRIVHLHSAVSRARQVLVAAARWGARATLVPSQWMLGNVRHATAFANWVPPVPEQYGNPRTGGAFVVGFLGRVSVDKGVPVLAQAMRLLDDAEPGRFRWTLAGEPRFVSDRDRDDVEASLAPVEGLIDRVGWVEPADFFARVDLLACPSIVPESFGLVAAEAMAARTPLIVSDAGALTEVVGDTESAIVPTGDAPALAATILRYAEGRVDAAAVEAGYARWCAEFSPEAGRERTRALLASLGVL